MEHSILISGLGGQGVMLMGQLLGYAASNEGREVLYVPSYGAEQRGGTANCTVIIGDEPIGAPNLSTFDVVVAMSEGALKKYRNSVNEGGKLIINSDFTESKADNENVLYVPALKLANETGNPKTANMVMLGALAGTIKSVSIENILGALSKKMTNKPELLEINKKAMDIGFELAGK